VLFETWHMLDKTTATSAHDFVAVVHKNIDLLVSICTEFTSQKTATSITFAACRVKAVAYFKYDSKYLATFFC
jgi:hypothetical protein